MATDNYFLACTVLWACSQIEIVKGTPYCKQNRTKYISCTSFIEWNRKRNYWEVPCNYEKKHQHFTFKASNQKYTFMTGFGTLLSKLLKIEVVDDSARVKCWSLNHFLLLLVKKIWWTCMVGLTLFSWLECRLWPASPGLGGHAEKRVWVSADFFCLRSRGALLRLSFSVGKVAVFGLKKNCLIPFWENESMANGAGPGGFSERGLPPRQ